MLGLLAGLRREEARFLAWRDVDLEAQLLRVTAKPPTFSPKSHGERTVPMNQELTDYLAHLRQLRPTAE
jgi:integrase